MTSPLISERVNVLTTDLATGTSRWVRELGPLSGVRASWARQGYCTGAQFTVDVQSRWGRGELPALRRGRSVSIFDGPVRLWQGQVMESLRDDGVLAVTAEGWATQAGDFTTAAAALDVTGTAVASGVSGSTATAVDAAISRGWRVIRPGTFGSDVLPTSIEPMPDLLSRGGLWGVNEQRNLVRPVTPAAATYAVQMIERPADTTSQAYLTDLIATYLSSTASGAIRYMRESSGRLPRVERYVDLTGLGPIPDILDSPTTSARTLLRRTLGQVAPLPPAITGAFTINTKGLLTLGGVVVPVSRLRPSTRLRLRAVQPSVDGSLNLSSAVEVDVDEVSWEADSDTVSVTPVAGTPRDLNGILELLVKPPPTALEDFAA